MLEASMDGSNGTERDGESEIRSEGESSPIGVFSGKGMLN